MKRIILWLLIAMLPILANAYVQVTVNGIKYELDSSTKKATVVQGSTKNSGDIVIPETFMYNGATYTVNMIDYEAFYKCEELTSVSLPNTVYFINNGAFSSCTKLKTINLPTGLMYLYGALDYCPSLTSIHIPANVHTINGDFEGCTGLTTITVDPNNTVYDSRGNCNAIILTAENKLVQGCKNTVIPSDVTVIGDYAFRSMGLTSIDIPSHIVSIGYMGYGNLDNIYSLEVPDGVQTIDGAAFCWNEDLETVTLGKGLINLAHGAFQDCQKLTTVKMMSTTPPTITNKYNVADPDPFNSYGKPSLRSNITLYVPASALETYKADSYWGTFKDVLPMQEQASEPEPYAVYDNGTLTFYYDKQKTSRGGYDIGPFALNDTRWGGHSGDITKVVFDDSFAGYTSLTSTAYWFMDCYNLTTIEKIWKLKSDNVTNMQGMFYDCRNLTEIDVSNLHMQSVKDMSSMFMKCAKLKSLDFMGNPIANVTDMNCAFRECSSLSSLMMTEFDTRNVTNMWCLFANCSNLSNLDLGSYFITTNVTDMSFMFQRCSKLDGVFNPVGFDTKNVTDMTQMFEGCSGLTRLDVSKFDTQNVKKFKCMFMNCSGLKSLDVSGFNTAKAENFGQMFQGCSGLTVLDLSNFNAEKVTFMASMFSGCTKLATIYCNDTWSGDIVTNHSGMFDGCTSLPGYSSNNTNDISYAKPIATGGYFTPKTVKEQCAKPVIRYVNGKLSFSCETEGVQYVYTVSAPAASVTENVGGKIKLPTTCNVTVFARKDGYEDSEKVTQEIDASGLKGDTDGDGEVDIADAVRIVNFIVGKIPALAPSNENNLSDPE